MLFLGGRKIIGNILLTTYIWKHKTPPVPVLLDGKESSASRTCHSFPQLVSNTQGLPRPVGIKNKLALSEPSIHYSLAALPLERIWRFMVRASNLFPADPAGYLFTY